MKKVIIISIKPEFANKIFDGTKTIELRKSSPKANEGDMMIIYSTSPEKAILGICRIKGVIKSTPSELWLRFSDSFGIDKKRYNDYYSDANSAVGIVLNDAKRFKNKIPLNIFKELFPNFSPPQTFKYIESSKFSEGFLL